MSQYWPFCHYSLTLSSLFYSVSLAQTAGRGWTQSCPWNPLALLCLTSQRENPTTSASAAVTLLVSANLPNQLKPQQLATSLVRKYRVKQMCKLLYIFSPKQCNQTSPVLVLAKSKDTTFKWKHFTGMLAKSSLNQSCLRGLGAYILLCSWDISALPDADHLGQVCFAKEKLQGQPLIQKSALKAWGLTLELK